jgi:hypothetical protein
MMTHSLKLLNASVELENAIHKPVSSHHKSNHNSHRSSNHNSPTMSHKQMNNGSSSDSNGNFIDLGGVSGGGSSSNGQREHFLAIDEDGGLKRSATVFGEKYRIYAREHYGNEKVSPLVYVKVKIYRLTNLDLIGMTVTVDFCLMLDWIDMSIIGEGKYPDLETAHFSPYVRIHNAKEELVKPVDSAFNRLQEGKWFCSIHSLMMHWRSLSLWCMCADSKYPGHVKRTERYRCTLYITDLNLSKYPFDKHDLKIILKGDHISLRAYNYKTTSDDRKPLVLADPTKQYEEVPTVIPRKDCQHSSAEVDDSHLTGWTVIGFTKHDELTMKSTGDIMMISMTVKRDPFGLVMILIVPLVVCIILSLTSFVLDPQSLSDRLQITVTMLLAAAAFHQQARGHVPPNLPYTTVLDKYMLGTLFILLLQAFVHVLIAFVNDADTAMINGNGNGNGVTDISKLSPLEVLFSCHPCLSTHGGNCDDTIITSAHVHAHNSSSQQLQHRPHRLSFVATLFLLVTVFHIYSKAGSWKKAFTSIAQTLKSLVLTSGTLLTWMFGGVSVLLIMSLGCRTISATDVSHFVSIFGPTLISSMLALGQCLQGSCSGATHNVYVCRPEVQSVLQYLLDDENLLEFMIFSIIFVHLVLWVEFLN